MSDDTLSDAHLRLLRSVCEQVVPASADGRLPSAGAFDLRAHVAGTMRRMPMLRPVVEYGLSTLADLAAQRHPDGWDGLSATERADLFHGFAAGDQFFMPALLMLVYSGYYQQPRVVQALGLEARAPHPVGHAMEPNDLSLLDPVRARGKRYRDC